MSTAAPTKSAAGMLNTADPPTFGSAGHSDAGEQTHRYDSCDEDGAESMLEPALASGSNDGLASSVTGGAVEAALIQNKLSKSIEE
jgi:hypothetical protein